MPMAFGMASIRVHTVYLYINNDYHITCLLSIEYIFGICVFSIYLGRWIVIWFC